MARVRFLVRPGQIRSRNDGDFHYVGAADLARLYGLPLGSWRVYDPRTDRNTTLPVLRPRFSGYYELPGGPDA